jgi:hypothetical protein
MGEPEKHDAERNCQSNAPARRMLRRRVNQYGERTPSAAGNWMLPWVHDDGSTACFFGRWRLYVPARTLHAYGRMWGSRTRVGSSSWPRAPNRGRSTSVGQVICGSSAAWPRVSRSSSRPMTRTTGWWAAACSAGSRRYASPRRGSCSARATAWTAWTGCAAWSAGTGSGPSGRRRIPRSAASSFATPRSSPPTNRPSRHRV